jgi:hypothetical protein
LDVVLIEDRMTSKFPLPNEVLDFRFLRGANLPGYVVLEFDTAANPIRVFLSRAQIEQLVHYARITVAKIDSDKRVGQLRADA